MGNHKPFVSLLRKVEEQQLLSISIKTVLGMAIKWDGSWDIEESIQGYNVSFATFVCIVEKQCTTTKLYS